MIKTFSILNLLECSLQACPPRLCRVSSTQQLREQFLFQSNYKFDQKIASVSVKCLAKWQFLLIYVSACVGVLLAWPGQAARASSPGRQGPAGNS